MGTRWAEAGEGLLVHCSADGSVDFGVVVDEVSQGELPAVEALVRAVRQDRTCPGRSPVRL